MTKKLFFIKFAIGIVAIFCVGCTMLVGDAVVRKYPTFQNVSTMWSKVEEGHGRVLLYFPRQGMKSFNPIGMGGMVTIPVSIDDSLKTFVGDRTFVFADLTAGNHIVTFKSPQRFSKKEVLLKIDVQPEKILYIELNQNYFNENPPRIVDEIEALKSLEQIRHNYKLPLPFYDQPKKAKRAI